MEEPLFNDISLVDHRRVQLQTGLRNCVFDVRSPQQIEPSWLIVPIHQVQRGHRAVTMSVRAEIDGMKENPALARQSVRIRDKG